MERKNFLKSGLLLLGGGSVLLDACSKANVQPDAIEANDERAATCIVSPDETEGPYPYPGGEIRNPLNRRDITGGQTGIPLILDFVVVNVNRNCEIVKNARLDIWHCNKDGYYSGYPNQDGGAFGTQNLTGKTWLRGYQIANPTTGKIQFKTIYPGWYEGRAMHIHFDIFVNNRLKKTGQFTFADAINDQVHRTSLYAAHGVNPTKLKDDFILNNSAADLKNETVALTGNVQSGFRGSYQMGIRL